MNDPLKALTKGAGHDWVLGLGGADHAALKGKKKNSKKINVDFC